MVQKWMWYTFVLILVFLALTRFEALTAIAGSVGNLYGGSVGILQGRTVSVSRAGATTIGGIAR